MPTRRCTASTAAAPSPPIEAAFPGVTVDGAVDRARLAERVLGDPAALARLEAIVHPLVRESEEAFLARCRAEARRIVVLDVPLLFETGGAERVDCRRRRHAPTQRCSARACSPGPA